MSLVRILQIGLSERMYGTENVVMNLYRNIDRKRYQFDFLIHHGCRHPKYEEEIIALGGHIYYQYFYMKERSTQGYLSAYSFFEMHPEIQGVHYHVNDYSLSQFRYVMAAFRRGLPVRVIHSHNSQLMEKVIKIYLHRIAACVLIRKYSSKLLACSKQAGRWNFGKMEFEILRNGIDTDRFTYDVAVREKMRKQYHLENRLVLGFAGRLHFQKNPEFLLKVLQAVNERCTRAVLVLLGEGELDGQLKREAKKEGLKNVLFMGRVENVHEWFQAFDVFLLPSRFEGLGLVLIEAQASGLMCIASDYVPREAAVTGRMEYLSTADAGKWADAVLKTDFRYDRNRGRAEVIRAGYDIRHSAKRLEEVYKSQFH